MVASPGAVAHRPGRFQLIHYIRNVVISGIVVGYVKELDAVGGIEPHRWPNQSFKLVHGQFQPVQVAGRRQAYT